MEPGETDYVEFTWNTTEYCDYIITGETTLDCDMDPTNDETTDTTRIHEWQYEDETEGVSYEDNTCGDPSQWKIVEECSICPDDKFWYNGEETNYSIDRDDVLYNAEDINMTGFTEAYLNFSTYYYIEEDFDYGYIEVSNDSGHTWFMLDTLTNTSGEQFIDLSYHLLPGTTELYSEYTESEFEMPTTFFTEGMKFRFRFTSDSAVNWKGWYIDDVAFNAYNGTWNILFEDDMEDGADKWSHHYKCYGNHWHEEDAFGTPYPGLDDTAYYNGENRSWTVTSATLINETTDWTTLPSYWNIDNNNPAAVPLVDNGNGYIDIYHVGGTADVYINQTNVVLPSAPNVWLDYIAWRYFSLPDHYIEITNGTTTEVIHQTIPNAVDTPLTADLSAFAGQTVTISFHFNNSFSLPSDPWGLGAAIY
jgi:hypothetical protein